ncbi:MULTISPECIES: PadR family transcriptional regulator [Microbacterium]|uniref:Transcriptional regulator PadR-like family protein n=1 Tax=Microbacterium trichothecenolyticum TaxID=69370 RepID=A0A0M2H6K3_MICTR|nr:MULTISPECIES: helix-turn-helix transcriptional regulator [Microbacterium]KJL39703.1 Transcriptional regulator PadR-like family protein [Microbacterium trichothecenolyticum]MDR7189999.1 DNA-binding PadR family transcriptional regulator [Microbacterium sp. BE35]
MQFVILGLLLSGPLSLYDLQKRFAAGISLFYSASSGSIQRALQHLVDDGAVVVAEADGSRRGRKVHRITDEGRERWRAWMRAPISGGTDAETVVLARVYLLGLLEAPEDRADVLRGIREHVDGSREALEALATEVDAKAAGLDDASRRIFAFQRATLEYGLRSHAVMREWIDDVGEQA